MIVETGIPQQKTAPLYVTRFLAAYLVLCHHFLLNTAPVFINLQEAVIYFYFLSGFVMVVSNKQFFTKPANKIRFNKRRFWLKRAAKIYPLYIIAFVACSILMCFTFRTDKFVFSNFCYELIGVQTWLDKDSLNYPGWSLSCELFFYVLFPFTVRFLATSSLKRIGIITVTLFFLNLAFNSYLSRFYNIPDTGNWLINTLTGASITQNPVFRYPIFLFGNFAGLVYIKGFSIVKTSNGFCLLVCLACVALIVFITQWLPSRSLVLLNGVLCPVYFVFVLAICSLSGKPLAFLSSKLFILAGEISYGCYILQVPVQLIFAYLFNGNQNFSGFGMFFIFTLVLIVISFLLYKYFELPMKRFILSKFGH